MTAKSNKSLNIFLTGYTIFLTAGIITLANINKGDIVIFLNKNATNSLDIFFQVITLLGLGGFFTIPVVIYLFKRFYISIAGLLSLGFTGLFTFLFKQVAFPGALRPTAYLQHGELTHFIEGFDYHKINSFPSGHTMTAFALFAFLTVIVNKKWAAPIFLTFAILTSISRMYLLQHFLLDVVVGSAIGLLCTWLGLFITKAVFKNNCTIMEGNIFTVFKK